MRAAGSARRPFLTWRRVIVSLLVLAIVGTLRGIAYWAVNKGGYQPARIAWKRLRAANVYVYDEVDPRFLSVDPRSLITIHTRDDLERKRAALVAAVFGPGGFPPRGVPIASSAMSRSPGWGRSQAWRGSTGSMSRWSWTSSSRRS